MLVFQWGDLAGVAEDGPALALLVGHERDDGRRGPGLGAQQLGHPPGQEAGDVLVAVVLVTEPDGPGCSARTSSDASWTRTWSGLPRPMGTKTAVGSRSAMASRQHGRHLGRRGPIGRGQVLVVGEVEPAVVRPEHLERGQILQPAGRHDVVARLEPPEGVPLRGHLGIGRGPPGQDGDHRRVGVAGQQVTGPHGGVVEVGRDDDDAAERSRIDFPPGRLGEGHGTDYTGTPSMAPAPSGASGSPPPVPRGRGSAA